MTVSLPDILDKVRRHHPKSDRKVIEEAYTFAERMHEGQMRKSGERYFTHPISVANIVADMRLDATSVAATLLHDVVEDCDIEQAEIEERFGKEVSFLVDGVTKLGRVNFISKEDQQAESFRKMLVAISRDIRVLLIKLADRLDNMRTLEFMKPLSQDRIARETLEIYAPLSGRLGIDSLQVELEDLSFCYLHPADYEALSKKTATASKETERYLNQVCADISAMLLQRGFSVNVSGRHKNLYSIWRKMRRTGLEFDQIHDLIAFRATMESVADCYAALGVIHSDWTPIPGRFKDYIALPKPNGYQSLHTTVIGPESRRVEIQIRTHEMHRMAEYGIASHWHYKQNTGGLSAKDAAQFAWLHQLMEFQQGLVDPAEFYDSVKGDLFAEEVYVFTPKGDVKTFPRGATPIDFSYAIHSEVGHHCSGARVNGSMVPLRYKLRNGDVVEVLTSKKQHPSKDWLNHVASSKARSKVRGYLREEERVHSIKLGRELLEHEMRRRDLSFARFLKSNEMTKTLQSLQLKKSEELFAQLGYGRLSIGHVMEVIEPDSAASRKRLAPGFLERTVRKVRGDTEHDGLLIEGMENILVRFAKCCSPVAGEAVTGWISRGRGVTVHRRQCPRALDLDPDRRVQVSWKKDSRVLLPVLLQVITDDRSGVLGDISNTFADQDISITNATCCSEVDRAVNQFHCHVSDLSQLRTLMHGLAKLGGVLDVERM